jgi:predicted DNA-binding transcriptional regulator YafY
MTMSSRNGREEPDEPLNRWARVLWLDRMIREGQFPNREGLQEKFGIKRRSAFDTLNFLRHSLGAPLAYSRQRRGYCYEDPTYALPAVFLQEGELLALLLAEQITRHYLGTPLEAPLRAAVGKISRYLPEAVCVQLGDVADCFQFTGASSIEAPLQLATDLQRAIRERRVVRIQYYTASRDETREREIEPHFLRNVRGDSMVVAWDRWRDQDRVFMLARIREHQVLGETFYPRPELSPDVYSEHTFLTEHGAEPYEVVLRFDAYQARWIRERTWHPSQRIEEQPDGGLLLRLTVAGEGDLLRWVLGYGRHVEVVTPRALRERVAGELAAAASLYNETTA